LGSEVLWWLPLQDFEIWITIKINFKGGGQECPPHTNIKKPRLLGRGW